MHAVAVVALDDVVALDLAIASDTLSIAKLPDGTPCYRVRVCGVKREIEAGAFRLRLRHGLSELARADTIILPGLTDLDPDLPDVLIRALRKAAARGARIVSICSGAFILAATGLLDGRRATTHWRATDELARRYPRIRVEPDVLYVDEGQLLTSAGAAAGIDLCVHIVRLDHGSAVAAETARISVMPLERCGTQSQHIVHAPPTPDGSSLVHLLAWLEQNLHADLTIEDIARRASLSLRSLNRRFQQQTGTTPLQWLIRARVRQAQQLLETTTYSIEHIAEHVGFRSSTIFREHFRRSIDASPTAYRRAFQRAAPSLRTASNYQLVT